jgi:hypothetical protein
MDAFLEEIEMLLVRHWLARVQQPMRASDRLSSGMKAHPARTFEGEGAEA